MASILICENVWSFTWALNFAFGFSWLIRLCIMEKFSITTFARQKNLWNMSTMPVIGIIILCLATWTLRQTLNNRKTYKVKFLDFGVKIINSFIFVDSAKCDTLNTLLVFVFLSYFIFTIFFLAGLSKVFINFLYLSLKNENKVQLHKDLPFEVALTFVIDRI